MMPSITIRGLSEETHRALAARAAAHGHSIEAEVRQILDDAVASPGRSGFGTRLAAVAAEVGGIDLAIERSATMTEPIDFS
jgi:plasmid stability protein